MMGLKCFHHYRLELADHFNEYPVCWLILMCNPVILCLKQCVRVTCTYNSLKIFFQFDNYKLKPKLREA